MKVCLVTDLHFGCRNDSKRFRDQATRFFRDVFFPCIDTLGIKTIVDLGDIVDRRTYVNFVTANRLRTDYLEPVSERGIEHHIIAGNHDTAFKSDNNINSLHELIGDRYTTKKHLYIDPSHITLDKTDFLLVPWMSPENKARSVEAIRTSRARVCLGHLELIGFETDGKIMDHGDDPSLFSNFEFVGSGHYHHPSQKGNIRYLGSTYQQTWGDYNCPRGFHIFDTDTLQLQHISNPWKMHVKLWYDDSVASKVTDVLDDLDENQLHGRIIKVIVKSRNNGLFFDEYMRRLEEMEADIEVVDDHKHLDTITMEDAVADLSDPLSLLKTHVDLIERPVDKPALHLLLADVYKEAMDRRA